ncbi:MAG: hypothetical protein OXG06_03645 [Gammaproteobacteria bacterium]|nr:hypothetical protein [Gammaproteobacteria bacterium]
MLRKGFAVVVLTILSVAPVQAVSEPPEPAPITSRITEARTLILSGRFGEALTRLRPVAKAYPANTDIHFLLALSAIESSRMAKSPQVQMALLDEAIAALHAILVDQPGLVRVRLELARAFFYKREDRLARMHFEQVLAGQPPGPVVSNVQRFLAKIRARRN